MPEGIKQSYSAISDKPFLKYWCHFSAKVGGINLFQILQFPHFVNINQPERFQDIFGSMLTHASSNEVYASMMVKSKLTELLSYYIMNLELDQITYLNVPVVEKLTSVLTYIDTHIEENMSVQDLAQMLHMHPNYFIRFSNNRWVCHPFFT